MAKTVNQWREENLSLQMEVVRLETSLKLNQERMADYEKRCADYQEQVLRLQDALVARESPDAYADRKNVEDAAEYTEEQQEGIQHQKDVAVMNRRLLDGMAEPIFTDADDMIEMLLRGGGPPEFSALRESDES